jgi:hypothetical protein
MPPLWQYFLRLHFEADFDGHEPEHVEGILDIGSTHVTLDTSNDGSLVGLIRTRCCGVLGAGRKPGHRKTTVVGVRGWLYSASHLEGVEIRGRRCT